MSWRLTVDAAKVPEKLSGQRRLLTSKKMRQNLKQALT